MFYSLVKFVKLVIFVCVGFVLHFEYSVSK